MIHPYSNGIKKGSNELTGSIPTELPQLTALTFLSLGCNDLSGSITLEMSNYLASLDICGLDSNPNLNLTGVPSTCLQGTTGSCPVTS